MTCTFVALRVLLLLLLSTLPSLIAVTVQCNDCDAGLVRCRDHMESGDTSCVINCISCVGTVVHCAGPGTTCEIICADGQCSGGFMLECGDSDTCFMNCNAAGSCSQTFEVRTRSSVPTIQCGSGACNATLFTIDFEDTTPPAIGFDIASRGGSATCSWGTDCDEYECALPLLMCTRGFGCISSVASAAIRCDCSATQIAVIPGFPMAPAWGSRTCATCTAGSIKSSPTECTPCPPSAPYVSVPAVSCVSECPAGYGLDTTGLRCSACPAGKSNIDALAVLCTDCPIGRFAPVPASPACTEYTCDPGTAPPSDLISPCADCVAGSFSDTGAACFSCGIGRFQAVGGKTTCNDCPVGETASLVGAVGCVSECEFTGGVILPDVESGLSLCHVCPRGQEPNADKTECELCSPGRYRNVNSNTAFLFDNCFDDEGDYSYERCPPDCIICPTGTVAPTAGSFTCLPCAAGLVTTGDRTSCREPEIGVASPAAIRAQLDAIVSQEQGGSRGAFDHITIGEWVGLSIAGVAAIFMATVVFSCVGWWRVKALERVVGHASRLDRGSTPFRASGRGRGRGFVRQTRPLSLAAVRGVPIDTIKMARSAGVNGQGGADRTAWMAASETSNLKISNETADFSKAIALLTDGAAWPLLQLVFIVTQSLFVIMVVRSLRFELVMDFSAFERNFSFGPITAGVVAWIALGGLSGLTFISAILYLIGLTSGRGFGGAEPYIAAIRFPLDIALLIVIVMYVAASLQLDVPVLWITWPALVVATGTVAYDIAGMSVVCFQSLK